MRRHGVCPYGLPATQTKRSLCVASVLVSCSRPGGRRGRARSPVASAVIALLLAPCALTHAHAQTTLSTITVRPAPDPSPAVGGLSDLPLSQQPVAATVIDRHTLTDRGARRLADLTALDASLSDAYNAPGYWDQLTIRGYTLDARFNYRREGLPISGETVTGLDHIESIEVLRGLSGLQAGTSAPGGLVNYVVKRPVARADQRLRVLRTEVTSEASVLVATDLSDRAGDAAQWGWRLNLAHESLRPAIDHTRGRRALAALALDWRSSPNTVLDAEVQWSQHRQRSQVGWSLLGSRLPPPVNPRINFNNQAWAQPGVFEGVVGTLRLEHAFSPQWRVQASVGRQQLHSDDRTAFPFGCGAENTFDRYCSDGSYDLYDYRSDNERRTTDAAQAKLIGTVHTGAVAHEMRLGALASRATYRFDNQAYNYVGTANVNAFSTLPEDPQRRDANTNRRERSTELFASAHSNWTPAVATWLGLRTTRIDRSSVRTDGSRPTSYADDFITPWAAITWRLSPSGMTYVSAGQGVESQVVPNRASQYTNAGQALPALKSKQLEWGYKHQATEASAAWQQWSVALFDITRPLSNIDGCARLDVRPCTGANDGDARHRGLELASGWRWRGAELGTLQAHVSAALLKAQRQGSTLEPTLNGLRPSNVPKHMLRAQAQWQPASAPGWRLAASATHEGNRAVVPDGSITTSQVTYTLGIDNLANRRYWREAPSQFGHIYLYAGAARTLRLAAEARF
jgi:iron complex outermembrane recepter protein